MMVPIEEVYPGVFVGGGWATDYTPLILSMGYEVLLHLESDDYQGETYVLFRDGERYGIGSFCWGSCTICDDLQRCESYAEIDALRQSIHGAIRWGTWEETIIYLWLHDWGGDASMDRKLQRRFLRQAKAAVWKTRAGARWVVRVVPPGTWGVKRKTVTDFIAFELSGSWHYVCLAVAGLPFHGVGETMDEAQRDLVSAIEEVLDEWLEDLRDRPGLDHSPEQLRAIAFARGIFSPEGYGVRAESGEG